MAGQLPVSPLALPMPELPPIAGVRLATAEAGIRYKGRTDVLLAELAAGTAVAGVFTRNLCPGAPVTWCRQVLPGGLARGLVVNAGNANVFNGAVGVRAVETTAQAAATTLGTAPEQIFLASTGVIGEPLPAERIVAVMDGLKASLKQDRFAEAAKAIMTTDTFPKGATRTVELGGKTVRINGIAKGSGMIAPDMATMLCFIFTDAAIPASALQDMLAGGVERTFNCVTIDSDTSTSDTVLLFATGQAGNDLNADLTGFREALHQVLHELALLVVRDGEGAQKFVTINVQGAVSDASAKKIGLAIANSPLVKTAIAGEDANWGRIVMAVGKAGEPADRDTLGVAVGGVWMARAGGVVPGYDEAPVVAHMKGRKIEITVDIGLGEGKATVWTCDLTHGYIDINGSYRS
ncbi:bifunctional glutamate N-acetyltransferase/amino-acid acetyltransferase ArgJ [Acidocella aminolytica]|uniref:Arginine biosynthesis bifunctional protein ArgJ n=1 Tax=Acidocella aminolytica 101 = DSM 11237 TaxID=1120923 RepID=A0A0D6PAT9_9PROT|nr:bifunctional glutamate N-acetyltransferase/amino-acid acetyltransferase ArgJ [Acidocella aminolytica]GAN78870.1 bifunctional ornithine acetyltransferase/N-acetylglutamate synthase [Acidocella aminolytica 101 = DSM 11237]GBQ34468.1 N-acetylglutamate synthase [Acidocella aminolytica 101 = DSM 11237]SHF16679.1 glutamate N-acetyltransferase [Acidocella aminolytica 101 = DSM 11237]